jgi:hypothetical protein
MAPFDLEAAFAAIEQAGNLEELYAAVHAFADSVAPVVKAASDPITALTALFGFVGVPLGSRVGLVALARRETAPANRRTSFPGATSDPRRRPPDRRRRERAGSRRRSAPRLAQSQSARSPARPPLTAALPQWGPRGQGARPPFGRVALSRLSLKTRRIEGASLDALVPVEP